MRSPEQHACVTATSTRALAASRAVAVVALALATGACSVSYPLYGPQDDIKTGSVAKSSDAKPSDAKPSDVVAQPKPDAVSSSPLAPPPGAVAVVALETSKPAAYAPSKPAVTDAAITPSDWSYARGALSLAMGADAVHASVPWANPDTGSYGSFSASAGAVEERGATCRAFAASHSGGGREQRLEGTACRTAAGYWEAVAIKATATRVL